MKKMREVARFPFMEDLTRGIWLERKREVGREGWEKCREPFFGAMFETCKATATGLNFCLISPVFRLNDCDVLCSRISQFAFWAEASRHVALRQQTHPLRAKMLLKREHHRGKIVWYTKRKKPGRIESGKNLRREEQYENQLMVP